MCLLPGAKHWFRLVVLMPSFVKADAYDFHKWMTELLGLGSIHDGGCTQRLGICSGAGINLLVAWLAYQFLLCKSKCEAAFACFLPSLFSNASFANFLPAKITTFP